LRHNIFEPGLAEEETMKMKTAFTAAAATATLVLFSAPAWTHEVPNIKHTHAFQKTGYGKYRQGHYVNGPQGSIVIWSPRTVNSRQGGKAVNFARPSPITEAPGVPNATKSQAKSAIQYGKQ
jgi:hypothetical protein